ncbi:hypothetical protein Y032_0096g2888 [Ancylostoma ceylanicum]|uniref:Secreted protein n=1 Tax=Ancylostoma ceylanicum TaxID=53326 RepID=A0A016TK85_9BILA|nr:hypothetical protein Y032_0096g2888 [Ancylostoma ceylanicum]
MNRLHLLLVFLVVFVKGSAVSADKERQHGHGHGQEREHTANAGFHQVVLAKAGILARGVDGAAKPAVSEHDAGLMQPTHVTWRSALCCGSFTNANSLYSAVRIPVKAATTQLRYHEGWALVLGDLLPFSRKAMRFHKRRSSSKI